MTNQSLALVSLVLVLGASLAALVLILRARTASYGPVAEPEPEPHEPTELEAEIIGLKSKIRALENAQDELNQQVSTRLAAVNTRVHRLRQAHEAGVSAGADDAEETEDEALARSTLAQLSGAMHPAAEEAAPAAAAVPHIPTIRTLVPTTADVARGIRGR